MNNPKLAKLFSTFAHIYEIRGDKNDFFRVRSYQNVVQTLENLEKDIAEYINLEEKKFIETINGIGKEIGNKIIEFLETGEIQELIKLKKTIPNGLLDMLEIKNLGPKKVKKFWKELQITNIQELEKAIWAGKVETLSGMGKKSCDKILEGIKLLNQYSQRKALAQIYFQIKEIEEKVQAHPLVIQAQIAGSFRRGQETVGDIDLLVAVTEENRSQFIQDYLEFDFLERIENQGDTKVTAYLNLGLQIDLRIVELHQFGAAMQYFTGNKTHNINLRTRAKKMGFKISEYGLFDIKSEKLIASKTEKEIYNKLGLEYIAPYLRGGTDEISLAENNQLPKVVTLKDIKGDCHMHSLYSDGKNSLQEMVTAAEKKGYEYIAFTDHSQSLHIANGLTEDRLEQKHKEIQSIQKNSKIKILHGAEVDILGNGELDYSDSTLKKLDFVIASIHQGFNNNPEERYIKAMQNPHVDCIGHLTTRHIGKRDELDIDYERIFIEAAKQNIIIEINASKRRMDIPHHLISLAVKHKNKFILNTDAHSTKQLDNMQIGVLLAQSARLHKHQIVNTLGYQEFCNLINLSN